MPTVAFYISGHGFGHASRQIEIINALGPRLPDDWSIVIRTAAAQWLFDRTVRVPITLVAGACDTGVVQIDSLHLDARATAVAAAAFHAEWDAHVAREVALLRAHDVRLVIADAPPLACAAAAAAGLDAIVCANFTWDWIYEGYDAEFAVHAPGVLTTIRAAYASAAHAWRLPLHGGFETIPSVEDVPLVARHARHTRAEVLRALGLHGDRPLALTSFGGYGLDSFDWTRLDTTDGWTVIATGRGRMQPFPPGVASVDESRIYDHGLRYEDLVAAVDVVVTKPGYGIVSECIANETALLYTSRGHFVEYDAMAREMPRLLRCTFISQDDLYSGRWLGALDRLLELPAPPGRPASDGAGIVAEAIVRML